MRGAVGIIIKLKIIIVIIIIIIIIIIIMIITIRRASSERRVWGARERSERNINIMILS